MRANLQRAFAPLAFVSIALWGMNMHQSVEPAEQPNAAKASLHLPMLAQHGHRLVENRGQWPGEVRYGLRKPDSHTWFHTDGWTHAKMQGDRVVALRMSFGDGAARELSAEASLAGTENWLVGKDTRSWVQGARAYDKLRYYSAFEGVDILVRKGRDPRASFEYDLELAPGASVEDIVLACRGQKSLRVTEDGSLAIETELGTLTQAPPLTWAVDANGDREVLACHYIRIDDEHFGFEVPGWDGSQRLVIDPGLVWSTYLGGSSLGVVTAIDVDRLGRITVFGSTKSPDFPTTPGAFDRKFKAAAYRTNLFVSRFTPDGKKLLFSTYLGGSTGEIAGDLDVQAGGIITVVGQTMSTDYPTTTGAYQANMLGATAGFVTKLDPTGSKLLWSTFFGGAGATAYVDCRAVDVDALGNVVLAGSARGALPTTPGAFQKTQGSTRSFNPFVAKFDNAGKTLLLSTFCGGTNFGMAKTVAVDAQGRITIAGHSGSADYPVTAGAYQKKPASTGLNYDAFVTQLDPTGSKLVWSTWIGGGGMDTIEDLELAEGGDIVFTGWTRSATYPTTPGVVQTYFAGGTNFRGDAFVSRLDASGSALIWSTMLGGSNGEEARALSLDAAGNVTVVGTTGSGDFPITKGAMSSKIVGPVYSWTAEGFVARLSHDAKSLLYSSFLGGSGTEGILGVATLSDGDVIAAGSTFSSDFPVSVGAWQGKLKGQGNGFVARVDMLPSGITRVGAATDCNGPVLMYPGGIFEAAPGTGSLIIGNAPRKTAGLLALGGGSFGPGFVVGGARMHVDPLQWIVVLPISSDLAGRTIVNLAFGQLPRGFRFAAQSVWLNNAGCSHKSFFSASAALDITLR
jgi:hypothetical protein